MSVTYVFSPNTKIRSAEVNQDFTDVWPVDWTDWSPSWGGYGSMTYTGVSVYFGQYARLGDIVFLNVTTSGTTGGTASIAITMSLPVQMASSSQNFVNGTYWVVDSSHDVGVWENLNETTIGFLKRDISNWGLGADRRIRATLFYRCAA